MSTLFVSDLHLDPVRPEITALFLRFLRERAAAADALYILGDLFEAWVGDDDPSEAGAEVASGLRALADAGVPVYFMHGNRDFLVGQDYARRLLCSDDTAYQAFRAQTRDPAWQQRFLAQPLQARLAFAAQARQASMARQQEMLQGDRGSFETVTDVTPATVEATLARFGVDTLVHGHTHRPAVHELQVDGRGCRRVVLGDWYEQGSMLVVDAGNMALERL